VGTAPHVQDQAMALVALNTGIAETDLTIVEAAAIPNLVSALELPPHQDHLVSLFCHPAQL